MTRQPTVLICDNETGIRRLLAERLRGEGINVLRVRSGAEAIKRARGTRVDIAVLDCALSKMDGIETALRIEKQRPGVDFIFLSGNLSAEYRERAIEKGISVRHWIGKGPNWVENAAAAVLESVQESRASAVRGVVSEWATQNRIEGDVEGLIQALQTSAFNHSGHPTSTRPITRVSTDPPNIQPPPSFPEVLSQLRTWLKELRGGYKDPALRRRAWMQFRRIVTEQLWAATEPLADETDKYKQQLADQFDRAIRKIKPTDDHNLLPEHIKAIALSLERLSSDKVDADDVHDCKKAWQLARVETLPSLGEILRKWEKPYADETGTDEQEED